MVGKAVRVMLVGDRAWQFRLGGDTWNQSIDDPAAAPGVADPELLDDARRLQAYFDLAVIGTDYLVGDDGSRHLLEVNATPTVTRFPDVRAAYLDHAVAWAAR